MQANMLTEDCEYEWTCMLVFTLAKAQSLAQSNAD